jgi:HPt (histidine-containing phosphotransfer) domain-containing protein
VAELREAIGHGDAHQLKRIADSLKGALAPGGATTAHTLAHELESMGQASHLDGSQAVLHKLEAELARLAAFFAEPCWTDRI